MKPKLRTLADPEKVIASALVALATAALGVIFITKALWLEAVVFMILSAAFLGVCLYLFRIIDVDARGVHMRTLLHEHHWPWENIAEVGIIGTRVFPRNEKNHGGRKFIYFSTETTDAERRFNMALRWPPALPYLPYSDRHYRQIAFLWKKSFASYNVGGMDFSRSSSQEDSVFQLEDD